VICYVKIYIYKKGAKMKRFFTTFALISLTMLATEAYATEFRTSIDINHRDMLMKAKRGGINIVTSPLEIPKQAKNEIESTEEKPGKIIALFGGTVKGLVFAVGRLGSGIYDVLTFNINTPKGYEPLVKPDYVCEKLSGEASE